MPYAFTSGLGPSRGVRRYKIRIRYQMHHATTASSVDLYVILRHPASSVSMPLRSIVKSHLRPSFSEINIFSVQYRLALNLLFHFFVSPLGLTMEVCLSRPRNHPFLFSLQHRLTSTVPNAAFRGLIRLDSYRISG